MKFVVACVCLLAMLESIFSAAIEGNTQIGEVSRDIVELARGNYFYGRHREPSRNQKKSRRCKRWKTVISQKVNATAPIQADTNVTQTTLSDTLKLTTNDSTSVNTSTVSGVESSFPDDIFSKILSNNSFPLEELTGLLLNQTNSTSEQAAISTINDLMTQTSELSTLGNVTVVSNDMPASNETISAKDERTLDTSGRSSLLNIQQIS